MTTPEDIKISLLMIRDYFNQVTTVGAVAIYNLLYPAALGREPLTNTEAFTVLHRDFSKLDRLNG